MENELNKLEELKSKLLFLQSEVEVKGDENGEKAIELNKLMEEFNNVLNNIKIEKNEI